MFLTELYHYYQRMLDDPDSGIAPPGFSEEQIGYVLVITPEGVLKNVISLLDDKGKSRRVQVPAAVKRSSGIAPNFLWDNSGYVLGVDSKGKPERSQETFKAFRQRHEEILQKHNNADLQAVVAFLRQWTPEQFSTLPNAEAILDKNLIFQLEGESQYLHNKEGIRKLWQTLQSSSNAPLGTCLVTGEQAPIARLHPSIKGVVGAQSSGAALVSFNLESFLSYGKEQSYNAPVSEAAAEAYTSALNYLLRRENKHSLLLANLTLVFWAERASPAESAFAFMLNGFPSDDGKDTPSPDLFSNPAREDAEGKETVRHVRGYLNDLRQGLSSSLHRDKLDPSVRFFILGLAPNASRLSVQLWLTSSFGVLAERAARHYRDLAIVRQFPDKQPDFLPLWQLLQETAVQGKRENIPAPLVTSLMQSIFFTGANYPEGLYTAILGRIRADKTVNYTRASIIKAYLCRNCTRGEISMSLDLERKDPPYLLGRLFSLLEKVQKDALGSVNAGIRDRYIGAASATPRRVFPLLLRLAQHHIKKSDYGETLSRRIQDVVNDLSEFPTRLDLEQQGDFFLGYYQQNVVNYAKKEDKE